VTVIQTNIGSALDNRQSDAISRSQYQWVTEYLLNGTSVQLGYRHSHRYTLEMCDRRQIKNRHYKN